MNSYWDLYVAYIDQCVRYNTVNSIDPHHYEMEWNHFLPKCVFGDQPPGQWLLLKQHAIATALQSLAFNKCCLFGGQLALLPADLRLLVDDLVKERSRQNGKRGGKKNAMNKTGICSEENQTNREQRVKNGKKAGEKSRDQKTGFHAFTVEQRTEVNRRAGQRTASLQYQCTVTGKVMPPGPLANWQKARGIDPVNRRRLNP